MAISEAAGELDERAEGLATTHIQPPPHSRISHHSGNVSSSSVNGDIAFLWEWSNFDHHRRRLFIL